MPAGGGDPKVIGDGWTVKIRPDWSRGNTDIWDMRDVVVALVEENRMLKAALAGAIDFAAFKAAVAALVPVVEILDGQTA